MVIVPQKNEYLGGLIETYVTDMASKTADMLGITVDNNGFNINDLISLIKNENWVSVMTFINDQLRISDIICRDRKLLNYVSELLGHNVKPFPINKVRINSPGLSKSKYNWHQDDATWVGLREKLKIGKDKKIWTLWTCFSASNKGNGLEVLNREIPLLEHSFVENQGFFNAPSMQEAPDETIKVYGPPFTHVLFSDFVPHRSLSGSSEIRISADLRFVDA